MNSVNIEPNENYGGTIELTDSEFIQLTNYIKKNYGISITGQKRGLLNARLSNVLIQSGYKSYTEFIDKLLSDKSGESAALLVNKITTNHTFFMREKDHFDYFRDAVLPYLEKTVTDNDLRIWCAACSTGEESYTLAMILSEYFGKNDLYWDTKILATDISDRALSEATVGVYSADRLSALPPEWISKYFTSIGNGNYQISEKIKNNIIYRNFNLMEKHYPFKKKFHVIFCRNVMIYFDNDTKVWLVNRFYDILEPGGYLFIGHSEFIAKNETELKYIMPAVYRKI
jgi:chemotaxis protein methyltransferase CheR